MSCDSHYTWKKFHEIVTLEKKAKEHFILPKKYFSKASCFGKLSTRLNVENCIMISEDNFSKSS